MNNQKATLRDIGGKIVKEDHRYVVKDNDHLSGLVVSSTELNAGHHTTGHRHAGREEVCMFISGNGQMEIDDVVFDVKPGDVILLEDGVFHKVYAKTDMYFICVFTGPRDHEISGD